MNLYTTKRPFFLFTFLIMTASAFQPLNASLNHWDDKILEQNIAAYFAYIEGQRAFKTIFDALLAYEADHDVVNAQRSLDCASRLVLNQFVRTGELNSESKKAVRGAIDFLKKIDFPHIIDSYKLTAESHARLLLWQTRMMLILSHKLSHTSSFSLDQYQLDALERNALGQTALAVYNDTSLPTLTKVRDASDVWMKVAQLAKYISILDWLIFNAKSTHCCRAGLNAFVLPRDLDTWLAARDVATKAA